jgi:LysM repeat protein
MRRRVWTTLLLVVVLLVYALSASVAPASAETIHVVRPGETLYSIGRIYGVNPYDIAALNGLANPNYIYVGQRLRIPGGGGPSPQPTPTVPWAWEQCYGATAICRDLTCSFAQDPRGTCYGHGGVFVWIEPGSRYPAPVYPQPEPTPTPPSTAVCDCSYNHYNCVNFGCQQQAQACYDYCMRVVGYDVHGIDLDRDGMACELWPSCY